MTSHNAAGSGALRNRLLAPAPKRASDQLIAAGSMVELEAGQVLFQQGEQMASAYFPVTAVLSLLTHLSDGSTVEFSTVGHEGTTGIPIFLGTNHFANASCLTIVPGSALRVDVAVFERALSTSREFDRLVRRYISSMLTHVGQTLACNTVHSTLQRCARWLLTTHDRVGHKHFPLTHELISFMLGVRRASVTVAARSLQNAGLISYRRGWMTIKQRAGLEKVACECYAIMRTASSTSA